MASSSKDPLRATLAEARIAPFPPGRQSSLLMEHGSMQLRFYAPKGEDKQTPHDQDELYFIHSGKATLLLEGEPLACTPGSVHFVPAGAVHRFIDFSRDFSTWVVFWGPKGGE